MLKNSFKKLMYKIIYKIPLTVKILLLLYAAAAMFFVSYKIKEARQENYLQQLTQKAQTGEKFKLSEIFSFKWNEAFYMAGEYDEGKYVKERYQNNYKISPALNETSAILAFFENGNCKFEYRFNWYSELNFDTSSSYILPDTYFTASLSENSNMVRLSEIANEKLENNINLEKIRAKNKAYSNAKPFIFGALILFAFLYFIVFSQYDRLAKNYKKKKCAANIFLMCAYEKPFILSQAINEIKWDEAKLFTHKYDAGFGIKAEDDYYCVIKQTNNKLRNTLVLFKDKKYVFDFAFDENNDFTFADNLETISADTVFVPAKSGNSDGYILSIKN